MNPVSLLLWFILAAICFKIGLAVFRALYGDE